LNLLSVTDVENMHYCFDTEDFHFGHLYEYKEEADPRGLAVQGVGFAAARLLGLRIRIPPGGSWDVYIM
jgi:hypothetical protein